MKPITETRDSATRLFRDYGGAILVAVLVALAIRHFVIEAYRIPSAAMRPNLEPGDTIFVLKYPFGLRNPFTGEMFVEGREPQRGEIVVFRGTDDPERDFIKRVVAVPGDRVELKKGRLLVNGAEAALPGSPDAACGKEKLPDDGAYDVCWEPPLLADVATTEVAPNSYFVLGDLRTRSVEGSRPTRNGAGLVQRAQLKGKAMWIWLSIEPSGARNEGGWFSRIRFERMLKRIL